MTQEEAERFLDLADSFARGLVERAAPVTYALATLPSDVEACFRLRYRTVVDSGWADPADHSHGLERDEFDDDAVHICGWDGEVLAACARLVLPDPGRPLPTEKAFEVKVDPPGQCVDIGRGIVAPRYRTPDRAVFLGLLSFCWLELRGRGFHRMCGDAADWLIDAYREMGFVVEVIGRSRLHWGERRSPIQVDGVASVRSVIATLGRRMTP